MTAGERNSYKAYFPVMINGELINSRMTVKEDDKGDLFWDLRLEDVSRKEIEDDLRKSTGEVISYDDYLAEQRRKAEELAKSRRSPWLRKTASNDNFPAVDRFYTKEQMKVIRSTLEETKYLEFLEKIWKDDTSVEKIFRRCGSFWTCTKRQRRNCSNIRRKWGRNCWNAFSNGAKRRSGWEYPKGRNFIWI